MSKVLCMGLFDCCNCKPLGSYPCEFRSISKRFNYSKLCAEYSESQVNYNVYLLCVTCVQHRIAVLCYWFWEKEERGNDANKKYAIFEFLFLLKKQKSQLQEYIPVDDPISMFVNYMQTAYELKETCMKALDVYGNLLNNLKRESI